jgi:hypothetical protein
MKFHEHWKMDLEVGEMEGGRDIRKDERTRNKKDPYFCDVTADKCVSTRIVNVFCPEGEDNAFPQKCR